MKTRKKLFYNCMGVALLLALTCTKGYAQENSSSNKSSSKEEGNRNVMLNAASANGPREIQIGLPSADVNVLENGLPVTYTTMAGQSALPYLEDFGRVTSIVIPFIKQAMS